MTTDDPDQHAPEEPVQAGLRELHAPPACRGSELLSDKDQNGAFNHDWQADAWVSTEIQLAGSQLDDNRPPGRKLVRQTTRWRCARCLIAVSGQSAEDVIAELYDEPAANEFGMFP